MAFCGEIPGYVYNHPPPGPEVTNVDEVEPIGGYSITAECVFDEINIRMLRASAAFSALLASCAEQDSGDSEIQFTIPGGAIKCRITNTRIYTEFYSVGESDDVEQLVRFLASMTSMADIRTVRQARVTVYRLVMGPFRLPLSEMFGSTERRGYKLLPCGGGARVSLSINRSTTGKEISFTVYTMNDEMAVVYFDINLLNDISATSLASTVGDVAQTCLRDLDLVIAELLSKTQKGDRLCG